jgi:hypothetical protein
MSSKRIVLRLYRQFLKQLKSWPVYEERKERSLGTQLKTLIRTQFTQNKNEVNPKKIEELIQLGERELQAMKNLLKNKYYQQVISHSLIHIIYIDR